MSEGQPRAKWNRQELIIQVKRLAQRIWSTRAWGYLWDLEFNVQFIADYYYPFIMLNLVQLACYSSWIPRAENLIELNWKLNFYFQHSTTWCLVPISLSRCELLTSGLHQVAYYAELHMRQKCCRKPFLVKARSDPNGLLEPGMDHEVSCE